MTFPVTLSLPFPSAPGLSPNDRVHYQQRAKAVAAYRLSCGDAALKARRKAEARGVTFPLPAPVEARITFVLTSRQRRDFLNLYASFKAGEDGIVDAGLLVDDDVWHYTPTLAVERGATQAVRVVLRGALVAQERLAV